MARATRAAEVPTFTAQCPAWQEWAQTRDALTAQVTRAEAAATRSAQVYRDAVAEYRARLEANAAGEDVDPGRPPQDDPTPREVAALAAARLETHEHRRAEILAAVSEDVERAAAAWWAEQQPAAAEHAAAVRRDAERLRDVLRQVAEVRSARDHRHVEQHGVRADAPEGPRTATSVEPAALLRVLELDADPFALSAPERRTSLVELDNDGPGLQRYEYDPEALAARERRLRDPLGSVL